MNKFEKYYWNKGIKKSLFGSGFLLNQNLLRLVKSTFKWLRIKKQPRVQQFMGINRYEN